MSLIHHKNNNNNNLTNYKPGLHFGAVVGQWLSGDRKTVISNPRTARATAVPLSKTFISQLLNSRFGLYPASRVRHWG